MVAFAIYGTTDKLEAERLRGQIRSQIAAAQTAGDHKTVAALLPQQHHMGKPVTVEIYVSELQKAHPAMCSCCARDKSLPLIVQNENSPAASLRFAHHKDSDPRCRLRRGEREHSAANKIDADKARDACLKDPVILTRTTQVFRNILGIAGGITGEGMQQLVAENDRVHFWKKIRDKNLFPLQLLAQGSPYMLPDAHGSQQPISFQIVAIRSKDDRRYHNKPSDVRLYAQDAVGKTSTIFPGVAFDLLEKKQDDAGRPGLYCATDKDGRQYIKVSEGTVKALAPISLDDIQMALKMTAGEITNRVVPIRQAALKQSIHTHVTAMLQRAETTHLKHPRRHKAAAPTAI
jgi:hypothetical protein